MVRRTGTWRVWILGAALLFGSTVAASGALVSQGAPAGAAQSGVYPFGDAGSFGAPSAPLNAPIVGMAPTPSGAGYWVVASDGGIFSYGDAVYYGSMGGRPLNAPIVGMAATPTGHGYWMVAADGGIFSFGDAVFYGSMGGTRLNKAIVGMGATPSGHGYWMVAADGGIFSFGDAVFYGSMGGMRLNAPVLGMAPTATGHGYWLVAADGGIFSFGDAVFYGSMGGTVLAEPVVGIAATSTGHGYWMVAGDGGLFSFGDAGYFGSLGATPPSVPVIGMAATPTGHGYWLVSTVSNPPTCQSPSLSLSFGGSSAGAGSVGRTYGLTNTTLSPCMLSGYPGLQLLGPSGALPTTVTQSTAFPVGPVGLVPNATAWFGVTYPSQTGFGNLVCPTSSALGVVPPGNSLQLVDSLAGGQIQAYGGTTTNLQCGQLQVTAVQAHPPF